jgi:small subunit ribosomal protein S16
MLTIRLQRTGRSGHAQFRVVVQDSRFHPTRGRVVAYVGSYDPHAKTTILDGEKISKYLDNGAQPSDRVASLLRKEGLKLPAWVKVVDPAKKRDIRNPEKLRRNRPAEETAPVEEATPEEPVAEAETSEVETPAEQPEAAPAVEEVAPEAAEETPAEEPVETPSEPAVEPETPAAKE